MTTPFEIIKSELLGKQIVVYKKTIEYEGKIRVVYSVQNDYTHRFETETVRESKKIVAVHYLDVDYDRWPTIDIELEDYILINISFDTPIEYA